ncbi:thiol-disulfide oxidoreductase ResA [Gracilibacillus oryzae]|uniref:Thiol-disulfide oxidoreductase ResA n=1 Tax=Gracilibacillus oryzae TaxID=1672701 RepID=A0A7C8GVS2_9BACI|nr:thiol-disulfide oxidoreductase ResA [Gracilibacillus oryzae]KAB8138374.1 thiol-disulfide oxidoreductase ResA [Gracilibacillus oryzae]
MDKIEQANKTKKNKKRNRLIYRTSILTVLFGALLFALISNLMADDETLDVGDKAPDFQLTHLNGGQSETIRLGDLKGKGVMLNFWATYCEPCEREMPYMETLYPEYKQKGVEIIAVSVDATELVIDKFVEQYGLSFPVLHDNNSLVMDAYGIRPLPTTFFIDENGVIVERVMGELTLENLEGYLQKIEPS